MSDVLKKIILTIVFTVMWYGENSDYFIECDKHHGDPSYLDGLNIDVLLIIWVIIWSS